MLILAPPSLLRKLRRAGLALLAGDGRARSVLLKLAIPLRLRQMRILVTGSSGTIGTRLCEKLLEQGHDIVGVDWKKNRCKPEMDIRTIIADLRDEKNLAALPTDSDAVVHLAANARVYELVKDPDRARDNFLSTYNVVEFVRKNKIPRLIFASSREVYGNAERETYAEDMVKIDLCESPYTATKMAGEALIHAYRRCYGMKTVILRFSNVYGEGKCLDFTYIDDTVSGIILALEKFDAVKGETFNIALGEGSTLTALAEQIKKLTGSSSPISFAPP